MSKLERSLIALASLAIIYQFAIVPAWIGISRKLDEMAREQERMEQARWPYREPRPHYETTVESEFQKRDRARVAEIERQEELARKAGQEPKAQ